MKYLSLAAAIIVAAIALPGAASAQPVPKPEITDFSLPSSVNAGQDITVRVTATNRGDTADKGSITVSFPQGERVAVVDSSPIPNKASYAKVLPPGSRVFNLETNQTIDSTYQLAELYLEEPWPTGAQRFMTLRVSMPYNESALRAQARATLRTSDGFFSFPTTGPLDQQGFPVLVKQAQVSQAAPAATPVPTNTPSPRPTSTPTSLPTSTPTSLPTATATTVVSPAPIVVTATAAPPTPVIVRPDPTAPATGASSTPGVSPAPIPTPVGGNSDSTASSIILLLGTLLAAGVIAGLAVLLTRHPRRATAGQVPLWPVSSNPTYGAKLPVQTPPAGYQVVGAPKLGGMAVVYKALQPALQRNVALKVLSPMLGADPTFVQRFYDEARRTAQLEHPNIVPIYDVGQAGGSVYIAMRYINGSSLQELLGRECPLSTDRAIAIAGQVAEALDYAHEHGVIHRDVKPANIMIENGDRVTLTDFGIAKVAGATQFTRAGSIVGTPDYLAPEQARGAEVDGQADLYSLAVVLYEMLAGRTPFQSDNPLGVVHAHVSTLPPSPIEFNPSIPETMAAVLLRALQKDPRRRFATCREFIDAMRRAAPLPV
jgi:serine/threonine-protein kinase